MTNTHEDCQSLPIGNPLIFYILTYLPPETVIIEKYMPITFYHGYI